MRKQYTSLAKWFLRYIHKVTVNSSVVAKLEPLARMSVKCLGLDIGLRLRIN